MQPLDCWDRGFESRRGHGCLSPVRVLCCHVEESVTGRSLGQRSPTEFVCVWSRHLKKGRSRPDLGCYIIRREKQNWRML